VTGSRRRANAAAQGITGDLRLAPTVGASCRSLLPPLNRFLLQEHQDTMTAATTDKPAHEVIELGAEDIPAYCPGPKAPLWSMHPRVYLDVAHTGSARCGYCGAEYRLKAGVAITGHGH